MKLWNFIFNYEIMTNHLRHKAHYVMGDYNLTLMH